jgi:hypothetical protein
MNGNNDGIAHMRYLFLGAILCAASTLASTTGEPEVFAITSGAGGRVATVMIPVGAVSNFSADAAVALTGADPSVEAMRLSGDVRIQVIGARQPIEITADQVVLELTADAKGAPGKVELPASGSAVRSRSSESVRAGHGGFTFLGHVSFTVDTIAGAMQIRAERVEHRLATGA